MTERT
jgi:ribosome silencing factor RsfS/YbeB/iojap/rRNA large subunit m3Psi methyltransferase RlmH